MSEVVVGMGRRPVRVLYPSSMLEAISLGRAEKRTESALTSDAWEPAMVVGEASTMSLIADSPAEAI